MLPVIETIVQDMDSVTCDSSNHNDSEDQYFTSYVDADIHRLMISDLPRTETYRKAIINNSHLFTNKTVMDVGAGTGILSLFMAQAGAKRIHAVEASAMANVLQEVVKENKLEEIIQVHHCPLEEVLIEDKVDVIVSECMGFFLLHECMFDTFLTARDKFLADDGYIFPSEARLYASPCTLQEMFDTELDYWSNLYGFNMEAVKRFALKAKSTKPELRVVSPLELLADPVCFKKFNLRYVSKDEMCDFQEITFVGIKNNGNYRGLCVWFECDFDGRYYNKSGEEIGSMLTLSTSPFVEPTHWKQTVIAFGIREEVEISRGDSGNQDIVKSVTYKSHYCVEKNEVVGWRLHFCQTNQNRRHYAISLEMLEPELEEHPIPCVCPMAKCLIIKAMIDKDDDFVESEDIEDGDAS